MNPNNYTLTQRRNGGLARSRTGIRHPVYKIFLPDDMLLDNLFPSTYRHGQAGGRANVVKAHRDKNGRFIKHEEFTEDYDSDL